jgi:hypothetical protein
MRLQYRRRLLGHRRGRAEISIASGAKASLDTAHFRYSTTGISAMTLTGVSRLPGFRYRSPPR